MARGFRFGNYGVYVLPERGQPHHLPHAHVMRRNQRVATVALLTLTVFHQCEPLPAQLVERIRNEQPALLDLWVDLNDG